MYRFITGKLYGIRSGKLAERLASSDVVFVHASTLISISAARIIQIYISSQVSPKSLLRCLPYLSNAIRSDQLNQFRYVAEEKKWSAEEEFKSELVCDYFSFSASHADTTGFGWRLSRENYFIGLLAKCGTMVNVCPLQRYRYSRTRRLSHVPLINYATEFTLSSPLISQTGVLLRSATPDLAERRSRRLSHNQTSSANGTCRGGNLCVRIPVSPIDNGEFH